ncbi:hypothetical protein PoB_002527600 [Plakobranchus ocellatus]|uniref:Uncharacterized protein n=1 Tax=Plakobranchus ocellatus TaxID=259542 RepID=A0AAV3ZW56_9GAST|nr:hypothetical protein PoB_002527600 [Plakobranchus ocellatus]
MGEVVKENDTTANQSSKQLQTSGALVEDTKSGQKQRNKVACTKQIKINICETPFSTKNATIKLLVVVKTEKVSEFRKSNLVSSYNLSYHRSIETTPESISKENQETIWQRLHNHHLSLARPPKLRVGDGV